MMVMFSDFHAEINLTRGKTAGIDFAELLYADDTTVVTNNVNAMDRLLSKIEEHVSYHGLTFNKTMCQYEFPHKKSTSIREQ